MSLRKTVYKCRSCGSKAIQALVWVNPNDSIKKYGFGDEFHHVSDWDGGTREGVYCDDCGEHDIRWEEV